MYVQQTFPSEPLSLYNCSYCNNSYRHIDNMFNIFVLATFNTFVTFVVFCGICFFLSPKLLLLLLLTVVVTIATPFSRYCSQGHLETSTCAKLFGNPISMFGNPISMFGNPISMFQYHFLNHCFGFLFDIALFLTSAQLHIKHFHPSNQLIYIQ